MANEITGYTSVTTAMRAEAGRPKAHQSQANGKPQPVQRQELPQSATQQTTENSPESRNTAAGDLSKAVDKINDIVQNTQRDLLFSIDEGSGRTTIIVRDSQTKEVIRQIPSEEVLTMVEHLKEATSGLLFKSDV